MHRTTRLGRVTLAAIACVALISWSQLRAADYDLLIRNASVVDGTGAPAYRANVLVKGDNIAVIDRQMRPDATAARVIDAGGRTLAPGFIDMHSHGDPLEQSFENFLAMGVTTVVLGQDGDSADERPFAQWASAAAKEGVQVNVAALSGHGSIRHLAQIPDSVRHLSAEQTERMRKVLREDLQAGTFGMSTGLEYVPGIYSEPAEVIELAREVGAAGGVIMSHMRSEDDDRINQSIDELAAQGAYARVHISHLKVVFGKGAERGQQLLAVIASKRKAGIDLTADAYPYTAGYTGIGILFPEWALPPQDYKNIVATRRTELATYLERRMTKRGGPEAMLFGTKPYAGQTLAQAAKAAGKTYVDFLIELGPEGGSGAHFTMDEATQDVLFGDPSVAVCTDGSPGMRHPRSTGTYAKLFERYVREKKMLTVEQAVHKAAGIPAQIMRFEGRGTIEVGAKADLVLFDVAKVHAKSSYVDPFILAEGFDVVIVNGQVAREDGALRPGRYGRILRAGRR
ncbi:MAG TPA: amidohydrolase family protein [Steroidobacteraceae bacterium]|nr:amidohydrolase family protein [Steroidobacteraceae bacterium]